MKRAGSVSELLSEGTTTLKKAGSESPGLDAEILLRLALNATRVQLFDALPYPVRPSAAQRYRELIEQRASGLPIAYIVGHREFYGHDFIVNRGVLVPRPETEFLVEYALKWLADRPDLVIRIVDVGTGSGAIAISVALETGNRHKIIATEVSPDALEVARLNRDTLRAKIELVEGSLLEPLHEPVDLILANLPYLRPDQAHEGIAYEPEIALYAGDDGFALNRQLLETSAGKLNPGGAIIMELDPDQASLARSAATAAFPDATVEIRPDLAGTARYLLIQT
jgi:release factor glutamine methyltransferase